MAKTPSTRKSKILYVSSKGKEKNINNSPEKKPEILIRNKEINLEKLISKQERLLDHAAKILKVGGYIVYCVCSINSREGVNQIESFLKNNLNFTTINIKK